jgi:hypothetical protein
MRRGCWIAGLMTAGLLLSTPAADAENLQEVGNGLTVLPNGRLYKDDALLHKGRVYTLTVSGIIHDTVPSTGRELDADAFYCFAHNGPPDTGLVRCQPPDPFKLVLLQRLEIGPFGSVPGFDIKHLPRYRADHRYTFRFRAPITSHIQAQIPTKGLASGSLLEHYLSIHTYEPETAAGSTGKYRVGFRAHAKGFPDGGDRGVPSDVVGFELEGSGAVKLDDEPQGRKVYRGKASGKFSLLTDRLSRFIPGRTSVALTQLVATGKATYRGPDAAPTITADYTVVTGGNDSNCVPGDKMTLTFRRTSFEQVVTSNGCLGSWALRMGGRDDKVTVLIGAPQKTT